MSLRSNGSRLGADLVAPSLQSGSVARPGHPSSSTLRQAENFNLATVVWCKLQGIVDHVSERRLTLIVASESERKCRLARIYDLHGDPYLAFKDWPTLLDYSEWDSVREVACLWDDVPVDSIKKHSELFPLLRAGRIRLRQVKPQWLDAELALLEGLEDVFPSDPGPSAGANVIGQPGETWLKRSRL